MEPTRRRWPRLTLVLDPDTFGALGTLAAGHFRDPKREALRLLIDGIERETGAAKRPAQAAERTR